MYPSIYAIYAARQPLEIVRDAASGFQASAYVAGVTSILGGQCFSLGHPLPDENS
jgi:hypothetical protein